MMLADLRAQCRPQSLIEHCVDGAAAQGPECSRSVQGAPKNKTWQKGAPSLDHHMTPETLDPALVMELYSAIRGDSLMV